MAELLTCQPAITLDGFHEIPDGPTLLGSMLFKRCVSGTRTVDPRTEKTVNGFAFAGYGAHLDLYPHAYLSAACAIGIRKEEIDMFLKRLDATVLEYKKQVAKQQAKKEDAAAAVRKTGHESDAKSEQHAQHHNE